MSVRMAYLPSSSTSPMAMPPTALPTGTPASISASDPPQTVAIELDPFDSRMSEAMRMVEGEASACRGRRARQRSVADLAASGPAHELARAHREGREVVMQRELLLGVLFGEHVEPLHVFLRAQRHRHQRLGLAAGEERPAVHARQQARVAGDL